MNKLFLLVLVFVLTFSSAFAGEVLINQETGQIRVESNPWRPVDAFEMEAFKNPGTEVPVWSSGRWKKISFFYTQNVMTATNVVVYKDKKIQSLAKEVKERDGVIFFLWYKIFLIIGMVSATVGALRKSIPFVVLACVSALVAGVDTFACVSALVAGVVAFFALIATLDLGWRAAKVFLVLYIILAMVAIVV